MVLVNPASALVLAMQIMLSGFFNNRESLFRWGVEVYNKGAMEWIIPGVD